MPGCRVERVVREGMPELIIVARRDTDGAACPECHVPSHAPHSTYIRRPADLPVLGRAVRVEVHVRRFYCRVAHCRRRTFAEPVPGLLDRRARRTRRLAAAQCAAAVAMGGEPAARLLTRLGMAVSADTLLRLVRGAPLPEPAPPRAVGVDDWALKRGRTYGTILVDLDAHRVVDLLPDRAGKTLAMWLRERPGIEVITRDRSTEYTRAATAAAPEAVQVADRWHLLLNVRQMAERWFASVGGRLRQLPQVPVADATATGSPARSSAFPRAPSERTASADAQARWRALYAEVRVRHAAGEPLLRISRALGLARSTVRRFATSATFPAHSAHPIHPSLLDPFLAYLTTRHDEGCENALQLWREIRAQGYPGRARQVHRWLQQRRRVPAPTQPTARRLAAAQEFQRRDQRASTPARLPSPRQLAWLVGLPAPDLSPEDAAVVQRVEQDAEAGRVIGLVRRFVALVRDRTSPASARLAAYGAWLADAGGCGIRAVETFVGGLRQDGAAVRAALTTPWSNAQSEGQITKLKLLKRQMYGRANFDLLRRRVLLAA